LVLLPVPQATTKTACAKVSDIVGTRTGGTVAFGKLVKAALEAAAPHIGVIHRGYSRRLFGSNRETKGADSQTPACERRACRKPLQIERRNLVGHTQSMKGKRRPHSTPAELRRGEKIVRLVASLPPPAFQIRLTAWIQPGFGVDREVLD
jgi:hypothetical protein